MIEVERSWCLTKPKRGTEGKRQEAPCGEKVNLIEDMNPAKKRATAEAYTKEERSQEREDGFDIHWISIIHYSPRGFFFG